MDSFFAIIVVLFVLVAGGMVLAKRAGFGGTRASRPPFVGKALLTDHERAFYEKLCAAAERVGAEGVFPQVAMAAIVDVRRDLDNAERMSARGRFSQKIIDFVLVDDRMRVMLIVELDDRTHVREKDVARDAITAAAGHRTARFTNGRRITIAQIEKGLRDAMGITTR